MSLLTPGSMGPGPAKGRHSGNAGTANEYGSKRRLRSSILFSGVCLHSRVNYGAQVAKKHVAVLRFAHLTIVGINDAQTLEQRVRRYANHATVLTVVGTYFTARNEVESFVVCLQNLEANHL
ncbi:hypothetical protein D3C86_1622890 [compost metagenome]